MHRFHRVLAVDLTGYSDFLASALREVVEHICQIVFSEGRRKKYAKEALEILLSLVKKSPFLSWTKSQYWLEVEENRETRDRLRLINGLDQRS